MEKLDENLILYKGRECEDREMDYFPIFYCSFDDKDNVHGRLVVVPISNNTI